MPNFRVPGWARRALRVVIALLFIYAGISKAIAPLRFVTDIANFHLLPWIVAPPLAFYLPWLEITCGIALLFFARIDGALWILLALTSVFVFALTSARLRGIDISCGCFGHSMPDFSFSWHLVLNLAVGAILLLLLRAGSARLSA